MQRVKGPILSVLLLVLCLMPAPQARAELVATSGDTDIVLLTPLRNGLSAATLVWPIDRLENDRAAALKAGLLSVAYGGTSSRSSYQIDTFLKLKGIRQSVSVNGQNLLLTVSAPDDVFPETLVHIENLLLEPEYTQDWYERELERTALTISSITRRPASVLKEAADFLKFTPADPAAAAGDGVFRFGRPSQIILRSGDEKVERRTRRLIQKLPLAKRSWGFPLAKWARSLTGADRQPFALPTGTIHFADPNSSEMLILFVKAEEFDSAADQVGANLLLDYIGANQGSEMFRIIRQEMRAAYSPLSEFIVMGKDRSLVSLSATVEAEKWPEIHAIMKEIYEDVRAGNVGETGLQIQHERLHRHYSNRFFSDPFWGAAHYLNEYPKGAVGEIGIPLFAALDTAPLDQVIENTQAHLPPLDDFLLILIGGGAAPSETLRSNGYCALPPNTPLRFCLDALLNAES